jgi:GH35 family endo-1,4-beta-xylanase
MKALRGKTFISGRTSTARINPEMSDSFERRMDEVTKVLIRKHNYMSANPRNIPIYVARSEFTVTSNDSTLHGHNLFWSTSKSKALSGARKLTTDELAKRRVK